MKTQFKKWMFAAAVSTVAMAGVRGELVSLTPVGDAEIEQSNPAANFGSSQTAVSGALGSSANHEIRRALFRFDLTGKVPIGATINSATVQVQVVRVPQAPANSTFDLRRVLQSWTESAVTWNTRSSAGTPWQVPGAIGANDSAPAASSTVFVAGLGKYIFPATPGLVADVQAWADDPGVNFGWLLISEDETSFRTARHFATWESGANAPVLTIDYSVPLPAITVQPQSQTVFVGSTVLFSVGASGVGPFGYQWQFNGIDISNAVSQTLVLDDVQTNAAGTYSVVVSNAGGSTSSLPATLTVEMPILPPPTVELVSPTNGARFPAHSDVPVLAEAAATNGTITQLEFLLGTNVVAVATNSPYSVVISNLFSGTYQLSARATDSHGNSNTATVFISAFDPPILNLVQPVGGQTFPLGTNILLQASLAAGGANVTNITLFANGTKLAAFAGPPYLFNWVPTEIGPYTLSAVATDELGQSGTSAPVNVRVFFPESVRPTLRITNAPPNFARLSLPLVSLAGVAADNAGLDRVEVQVNSGGFEPASGTNAWSAGVALIPGLNTVQVRSVDLAGNVSPVITRFFTLVARAPLVVRITGQGTVTPDLNGDLLEIGRLYRLKAKAAAGYVFDGWDGVVSQQPALSFLMQSNLVLTANFIENPFASVQGNYAGTVLNTNAPTREGSGIFALRLRNSGNFTGWMRLGARRTTLRGRFDSQGLAQVVVLRSARPPILLTLNLDLISGTDTIRGTATDGTWTSAVIGNRGVFDAKINPAPVAGAYSFALRRMEETEQMEASGVAKIKTGGGVSLSGKLTGGGRFSLGTTLAKDGTAPFYISVQRGSEEMIGSLVFSNGVPEVSGSVYWFPSGSDAAVQLEAAPISP